MKRGPERKFKTGTRLLCSPPHVQPQDTDETAEGMRQSSTKTPDLPLFVGVFITLIYFYNNKIVQGFCTTSTIHTHTPLHSVLPQCHILPYVNLGSHWYFPIATIHIFDIQGTTIACQQLFFFLFCFPFFYFYSLSQFNEVTPSRLKSIFTQITPFEVSLRLWWLNVVLFVYFCVFIILCSHLLSKHLFFSSQHISVSPVLSLFCVHICMVVCSLSLLCPCVRPRLLLQLCVW